MTKAGEKPSDEEVDPLLFHKFPEDDSWLSLRTEFVSLKAPLVIYMLDRRMGKGYLHKAINKVMVSAISGELQAGLSTQYWLKLCRKLSEKSDLRIFADQWIYGSGCPKFTIRYKFNRKKMMVEVNFKQENTNSTGVNPTRKFTGPFMIRVHEPRGVTYDTEIAVDDIEKQHDILYHTKYKRSGQKLKKLRKLGEELGGHGGDDDDGDDLLDNLMPDENAKGPDLDQFDSMWIDQLTRDIDVVAQFEAIVALGNIPSDVSAAALSRVVTESRYFYRLRMEAAYSLAKCGFEDADGGGMLHLFRIYRDYHCFPAAYGSDTIVPRPHNFQNYIDYFVKKFTDAFFVASLISSLAASFTPIKQRSPATQAVRASATSSAFTASLVGYESLVEVFDVEEEAIERPQEEPIKTPTKKISEVEALPDNERFFFFETLEEIERYLLIDRLKSSYHNIITVHCLDSIDIVTYLLDLIDFDPIPLMRYHVAKAIVATVFALKSKDASRKKEREESGVYPGPESGLPENQQGADKKNEASEFSQCQEVFKDTPVKTRILYEACAPPKDQSIEATATIEQVTLPVTVVDVAKPKIVIKMSSSSNPSIMAAPSDIKGTSSQENLSGEPDDKNGKRKAIDDVQPLKRIKIKKDDTELDTLAKENSKVKDQQKVKEASSILKTTAPDEVKGKKGPRQDLLKEPFTENPENGAKDQVTSKKPKEKVPIDSGFHDRCNGILSKLKNHPSAIPFLQPVDDSIAPGYSTIILTPMDLSTVQRRLDKGRFKNDFSLFSNDIHLIFANCLKYNGEYSPFSLEAKKLEEYFIELVRLSDPDSAETKKPKGSNIKIPLKSIASSPSALSKVDMEVLEKLQKSEESKSAPANDVDFYKTCRKMLKGLMDKPEAAWFLEPVDPVKLNLPNYFQVIKKPMDFSTLKALTKEGKICNLEEFAKTGRLIFKNAMKYNPVNTMVHQDAIKMLKAFDNEIKTLESSKILKVTDKQAETSKISAAVVKPKEEPPIKQNKSVVKQSDSPPSVDVKKKVSEVKAAPQAISATDSKKCIRLLKKLQGNKHASVFLQPVDPIALGIPEPGLRDDWVYAQGKELESFFLDEWNTLFNPTAKGAEGKAKEEQKDKKFDLQSLIQRLRAHPDALIFLDPVDRAMYPDYYEKIRHPMDLKTMLSKATEGLYTSFPQLEADFRLMITNCLTYNAKNSFGYKAGVSLEKFFRQLQKKA
ncbi:hypothetical protein HDU96_001141 [Phlyctochytrium bullatum]|nr:hypothetical protein HDU96_001141 [Phlyctochytrium bullatum]